MKAMLAWSVTLLALGCGDGLSKHSEARATLTVTPLLDLALHVDDSVLIGRLVHATRMTDGRIVAVDADGEQLVVLDSTGALLAHIGRPGAGPGEFDNPSWVGRCHGDSLFVWDASHARISVFDPLGGYVRQFTPPVASPFRMACNGLGLLAAFDASSVPFGPPRPGVEPEDLRGPLLIFNAAGDTLGGIAGVRIGQSRVLGPLASLGLRGDELFVGVSDSATFRRFNTQGTELARDTIPMQAQPMSDSVYQAELDRLSGFAGAMEPMRSRIREMLAGSPKPSHRPLYQSMFVSPNGTIWLVTSLALDPTTTLLSRDASGRLSTAELPAGVEAFEIGDDYLLGRIRAEDGQERLVMYRISGSGS